MRRTAGIVGCPAARVLAGSAEPSAPANRYVAWMCPWEPTIQILSDNATRGPVGRLEGYALIASVGRGSLFPTLQAIEHPPWPLSQSAIDRHIQPPPCIQRPNASVLTRVIPMGAIRCAPRHARCAAKTELEPRRGRRVRRRLFAAGQAQASTKAGVAL
jgi:hypothetical protein